MVVQAVPRGAPAQHALSQPRLFTNRSYAGRCRSGGSTTTSMPSRRPTTACPTWLCGRWCGARCRCPAPSLWRPRTPVSARGIRVLEEAHSAVGTAGGLCLHGRAAGSSSSWRACARACPRLPSSPITARAQPSAAGSRLPLLVLALTSLKCCRPAANYLHGYATEEDIPGGRFTFM